MVRWKKWKRADLSVPLTVWFRIHFVIRDVLFDGIQCTWSILMVGSDCSWLFILIHGSYCDAIISLNHGWRKQNLQNEISNFPALADFSMLGYLFQYTHLSLLVIALATWPGSVDPDLRSRVGLRSNEAFDDRSTIGISNLREISPVTTNKRRGSRSRVIAYRSHTDQWPIVVTVYADRSWSAECGRWNCPRRYPLVMTVA